MKTKHLILAVLSLSLSQIVLSQQEFVYKTVNGHAIKASIYLPTTKGPHPVLIYYHGGGFVFGNKDQGLDELLKTRLLASNYAVISANYRLAPETKLDGIMEDVADMVQWVRQHGRKQYGIDPKHLAVAGGSAGGYLALSTAFNKKSSPNAIISISAPTGFSPPTSPMGDIKQLEEAGPGYAGPNGVVSHGDYTSRMALWRFLVKHNLGLYAIFGFDPFAEPSKLEPYRLTSNLNAQTPPILLIHARNDRLVDVREAEKLHQFLIETNAKAELFLVDNGHSSEVFGQHPEAIDKIIDFLTGVLK